MGYCILLHCLDSALSLVSAEAYKHMETVPTGATADSRCTARRTVAWPHTQAKIPVILRWGPPAVILIWDRGETGAEEWPCAVRILTMLTSTFPWPLKVWSPRKWSWSILFPHNILYDVIKPYYFSRNIHHNIEQLDDKSYPNESVPYIRFPISSSANYIIVSHFAMHTFEWPCPKWKNEMILIQTALKHLWQLSRHHADNQM